jgi:hypothetical protein
LKPKFEPRTSVGGDATDVRGGDKRLIEGDKDVRGGDKRLIEGTRMFEPGTNDSPIDLKERPVSNIDRLTVHADTGAARSLSATLRLPADVRTSFECSQ